MDTVKVFLKLLELQRLPGIYGETELYGLGGSRLVIYGETGVLNALLVHADADYKDFSIYSSSNPKYSRLIDLGDINICHAIALAVAHYPAVTTSMSEDKHYLTFEGPYRMLKDIERLSGMTSVHYEAFVLQGRYTATVNWIR